MDPTEIFEDLKQKIIWLDLEPGSTLNQVEIAKSYGVSRNPLAIALTKLESEEWLVRNGAHFVVSPLGFDKLREIIEIRSVLENQANIWAMSRIGPEGLAKLKALRDEFLALEGEPDRKTIIRFDFRFHCIIYRETCNRALAQILERLLCHYLRFWLDSPQSINKEVFLSGTVEIIRALEEKDEVRLKAATAAHIMVSLDTLMGIS